MRFNTSSGTWRDGRLDPACDRAHLLITRQIDGELQAGDARDLRAHLSGCAACRQMLEAQAAQSRSIAASLKELWKADDAAAFKKKEFSEHSFSLRVWRIASNAAACAALAGIVFFSTRAHAPGTTAAVAKPADGLAASPALVLPSKISSSAPAVPSSAPVPNVPDEPRDDVALEEDDGVDSAEFTSTATKENAVPAPLISVPQSISLAPTSEPRGEQTLAALAPSVPLKPIPGVALKYAIVTESGAPEEGVVTVCGDVLRGKAIVRIETSKGEVFDAAQAEIDSAFTAERRAVARKLLDECASPERRERLEKAIKKLGE